MLNILSWNILHGGGSRVPDIIKVIEIKEPDIVCLQEFRHGRHSTELLDGLKRLGLNQQYTPLTNSARENTVIIASRYEFTVKPLIADKSPVLALNAYFPTLPMNGLDEQGLNLIVGHFPHKKAQLPYFQELLELPTEYQENYSLIVGDLNCGIPFEDSETKSFYATHLFQRLLSKGWIDAWRSRNPKQREFTWISTKHQNGFRYDHAIVSEALNEMVGEINYDHDVRLQKISDHSSLSIQLK